MGSLILVKYYLGETLHANQLIYTINVFVEWQEGELARLYKGKVKKGNTQEGQTLSGNKGKFMKG